MNSLTYTPVGTTNLKLTIKEMETLLRAEYLAYGHKKVGIKYVMTTQQVEIDPITDVKYTFDQYVFNIETEYGRFKVKFNSSDGYTMQ